MFSIDIKILLEFIQKHWENTKIFSILLFLLFLLINYFFGKHKIINETFNIDYYTLFFSICIIIVVLLIRHFTNILPKRRKDNLLILIAINTETEEEQNRLKNDFIHNLNEIVKSDEFDKYKIETLSKYHTIEACKDVKTYHIKTNAHFIIFGNCEKRYDDSEEKYILNLHASVAHRYAPYNVKNTLLKEMKNVFPHETVFSKQNEFNGFHIASETIGYATRYIMGLASLISYDPFTAFNIHHNLYNEINSASLSNPYYYENIK